MSKSNPNNPVEKWRRKEQSKRIDRLFERLRTKDGSKPKVGIKSLTVKERRR